MIVMGNQGNVSLIKSCKEGQEKDSVVSTVMTIQLVYTVRGARMDFTA